MSDRQRLHNSNPHALDADALGERADTIADRVAYRRATDTLLDLMAKEPRLKAPTPTAPVTKPQPVVAYYEPELEILNGDYDTLDLVDRWTGKRNRQAVMALAKQYRDAYGGPHNEAYQWANGECNKGKMRWYRQQEKKQIAPHGISAQGESA